MGCSPSKGSTFVSLGAMRKGRMLPSIPQESKIESQSNNGENEPNGPSKEDLNEKETPSAQVCQKKTQMTPKKQRQASEKANTDAVNIDKVEKDLVENSVGSLWKEKNLDKQESEKINRKTKIKSVKVLKKKDKTKLSLDQKVDFPEPLVKAHQAAYAFLNPSINEYDSLLVLMEQATKTQMSVQPMVAFMALRYQEIIKGLEEMAGEGEKVLKEYGQHLAWPSQMKNLSSASPRRSVPGDTEAPPDLLQQLLQYTTQRMRNVSQTVAKIGDSALEEAVDYFASVLEILEEKLKVKRIVEARLMQVLTRIEMASLRKPGPEDSALFSEDSGIGAENESLNGSEKHRRRESCGSAGSNKTSTSSTGYNYMNTVNDSRKKRWTQISPSISLASLNSLDSACTLMPDDQRDSLLGSVSLDDGEDDQNDEMDVGDQKVAFRLRSNSSPADGEKPPCRLPPKRIENPRNVEMTLKMKNAISGRIQFLPKQNSSIKAKATGSPKTNKPEWTDGEIQSPKRPQTAAPVRRAVKKNPVAKGHRSRSAESLRSKGEDPTLLELERTQKDLNQRLQRMDKSKMGGNGKTATFRQTQGSSQRKSPTNRKQTSQGKDSLQPAKDKTGSASSKKENSQREVEEDKVKNTSKGPIKATPPTSPPSSPQPSCGFQRGRNSVKKLIDSFSQGLDDREAPKILGPLKGVRRCGVPVLPGIGNVEAVLTAGSTSCRAESTTNEKAECLDLDSLPPPPLEVLMDNSFESVLNGSDVAEDGGARVGKSPLIKRTVVSQRLRASVQSVPVLPSKVGFPQPSKCVSPAKLDQQDKSASSMVSQSDVQQCPGAGSDSLAQQARKIVHLRKSIDSTLKSLEISKSQVEPADPKLSSNPSMPESNPTAHTVPPTSETTTRLTSTPPASKGRTLPSTPSSLSNIQKILPNSMAVRKQSSPPSTSFPVNRTLPTPPTNQRRLPSPPVSKQNSGPTYYFKAPSPPASPKGQRWSRQNSSEDLSSSRNFSNARSVFCPVSSSLFEAQPSSLSQPTQAWTSNRVSVLTSLWGSRGRYPVCVQGPRPFVRRSQSDRRPSLSMTKRSQGISVAETCGSEPSICSKGLVDEPIRAEELWRMQSELRATPRSASQPDLCIVGQSLHRGQPGGIMDY